MHPHNTLTHPTPLDMTHPTALQHHGPEPLPPIDDSTEDHITMVVLYDIACQWAVHIWERMTQLLSHLQFDHSSKKIIFLIPKFHLPAHIEKCQTGYSFNLTLGVGQTDGEAPECGWSFIDPLSTSTKEMGPASY